jgi:hypothetical protein
MKTTKGLSLYSPYSPDKNDWSPAFLHRNVLMNIWGNDVLCSEVESWDGDPLESWFRNGDMSEITIGKAYFSEDSISFVNGRHRTRWMLQQGFENIPVCLPAKSYFNAGVYGLLNKRVFDGELIY